MKRLKQTLEEVQDESGSNATIFFGEGVESVVPLDEMPADSQTLVVFDDLICEKNVNSLGEYWIRSRHKGISCIFLTQSYTGCPLLIRRNTDFWSFFSVSRGRDLNLIHSDLAPETGKELFKKKFLEVTGQRFHSFSIDLNGEKKYRRDFSEALTIE